MMSVTVTSVTMTSVTATSVTAYQDDVLTAIGVKIMNLAGNRS